LAFDKPVCVNFLSDPENARNALGKTGYYDPESYEIGIYIDNRHPKDVLRSLAHELVHHAQNCAGMFKSDSTTSPGYAQKDPHLRRMERDAYERGNLCLRDWEDSIKIKLQETNYHNKRFKINEQLINNRYNNNYIIYIKSKSGVNNNMKLSQSKLKSLIKEAFEEAGLQKGLNMGQEGGEETQQTVENDEVLDRIRNTIREALKNTPEVLNILKKGNLQESPTSSETVQATKGAFAPNHYCVHHGGVSHNGGTHMAEAVSHNYDVTLGRVTHYNMKLADGTILENIAAEDIQVTNASLAEGHGHPVRDDDDEKELDESPAHPASDREGNRATGRRSKDVNTGQRKEQNESAKPDFLDLDDDGDKDEPMKSAASDAEDVHEKPVAEMYGRHGNFENPYTGGHGHDEPEPEQDEAEAYAEKRRKAKLPPQPPEVQEAVEEDDTLEEVFLSRNKKLYENLVNWAKK
jgi:hypothetical protein